MGKLATIFEFYKGKHANNLKTVIFGLFFYWFIKRF